MSIRQIFFFFYVPLLALLTFSSAQLTYYGNTTGTTPYTTTTTLIDTVSDSTFTSTQTFVETITYPFTQSPYPGYSNLPASLSSQCNAQWYSHILHSTNTITSYRIEYQGLGYSTTDAAHPSGGEVITTEDVYTTYTYIETDIGDPRWFTASPPCCSSCSITASTIQLFFWPTPAPSALANVTTMVSDGFTFTSPSVYIAFSSMKAMNLCGQVGPVLINQTLAFGPTELSSLAPCTGTCSKNAAGPPLQINYADFSQNCSAISGYQYFSNNPQNDINNHKHTDPCHPVVAVPTAVLNLYPEWHDCLPNAVGGFYDPPIALAKQTALILGQQPAPTPASPIPAPPIETVVSTNGPVSTNVIISASVHASTDFPAVASTVTPSNQRNVALKPVSSLLPSSTSPAPEPAFTTIGTHIISALPSQAIAIGSTTLSAGGPGITVSGTFISVAPSGTVIIGSSVVPIPTVPVMGIALGAIINSAFGGGTHSTSSVLTIGVQSGTSSMTSGLALTVNGVISSSSSSAPFKGDIGIGGGSVLAKSSVSTSPGNGGNPSKSSDPANPATSNTALNKSVSTSTGNGAIPSKSTAPANPANGNTPPTASISTVTNNAVTSSTTSVLAFTGHANFLSTGKLCWQIGIWLSLWIGIGNFCLIVQL